MESCILNDLNTGDIFYITDDDDNETGVAYIRLNQIFDKVDEICYICAIIHPRDLRGVTACINKNAKVIKYTGEYDIFDKDLSVRQKQIIYDSLVHEIFNLSYMIRAGHFASDEFTKDRDVAQDLIFEMRREWKDKILT